MIVTEWLFQEPIENKHRKVYNPKPLREIARKNINLDDTQIKNQLAKKMLNPYYFTDRASHVGVDITLDSHHNIPNQIEFGIELQNIEKILREMAIIYARIVNQHKLKYQTIFSARFEKQDEHNHVLDETELFNNLNSIHNLTELDNNKNDNTYPSEHQIQKQEMKDSGWRSDKIKSITIYILQN